MTWDPEARTREVLDGGARIGPLDDRALDHRHHEAMEALRIRYGYPEGMPIAPFFLTLAHSPEFFAGFMALGVASTLSCALPERLRELAILRTGWLLGAPFQWGEHVHTTRDLFTPEDVARVREGPAAPGWSEKEATILRAVDELKECARIGNETWAALSTFLDERQLVELPLVVGHYTMTAYLQNSLATPLNDHNPGLVAG